MLEAKKWFGVFFVLLIAFGSALRAEEPEPVTGPTIVLPTYSVRGEIVGYDQEAGWRYCSLPGLEVLGKGNDGDFKDTLRDFLMFRSALDIVWPKALTSDQLPAILVFCDDYPSFNKFLVNGPIGARSLSKGDQAIVVHLNILRDGRNAAVVETLYIGAILDRIEMHSAPWLNRGLLKAFMGVSYSNGRFHFPSLTTDETLKIRRAGSIEDLENALKAGTFLPLSNFSPQKRHHLEKSPFQDQKTKPP